MSACTKSKDPKKSIDDFLKRAQENQYTLKLPDFETHPDAVKKSIQTALDRADQQLDKIAKQDLAQVSFDSFVRAVEFVIDEVNLTLSRVYFLGETSQDKELRDVSNKMVEQAEKWSVDVLYREDLYRVAQALEKKQPNLNGEDAKLFKEMVRDYRRAGLHLPRSRRDQIKKIRKDLAELETTFRKNITESKAVVTFRRSELEGVPDDYLKKAKKKEEDRFQVNAHTTWEYFTVVRNAVKEKTRKAVYMARYSRAKKNLPVLKSIVEKRATLAKLLGYKNWAEYKLEIKMAKNSKTVFKFLKDLSDGLEPLFKKEIADFQRLKAKDTGNPKAKIWDWDARYYYNQIQKDRFSVDHDQLKAYFPLDQVLEGMFRIYQKIFGLKFTEVEPPYRWEDSIRLFVVSDRKTDAPLGAFYLDLFPRDGKYSHFAAFPLVKGALLPSGFYRRPVVALVCNFIPPEGDQPSLLLHSHVETLFHEFGHAMHGILTQAKYPSFSGTSVPRDFVEAPSQMLESWVWDKVVLDTFAVHYQDSEKKFPKETLEKMIAAKKAGNGRSYRFQLALGMLDMKLHSVRAGQSIDVNRLGHQVFRSEYLETPPGSLYVGTFGHLGHYDAGYYGYLWSQAISEDMASVFEQSPLGFLDEAIGMRLRKEIYEPGDSRDVNQSIMKFLGRKRSLKPFLEELGISAGG